MLLLKRINCCTIDQHIIIPLWTDGGRQAVPSSYDPQTTGFFPAAAEQIPEGGRTKKKVEERDLKLKKVYLCKYEVEIFVWYL